MGAYIYSVLCAALFCALTAALVFAAWLLMDAQGVSFVYSEF